MKSKASFRRHPIHPSLIPFPFAFLLGSLVFDLIGWIADHPTYSPYSMYSRTAAHLAIAGLIAGVIAAIPGVIDYLYSVPPGSSARSRARRHGIANVSALALFAVAWSLRGWAQPPSAPAIALELAGALALIYAGWEGGVLVTRNMISVDHRHAQAGKWSEIVVDSQEPVRVAARDELKPGQMKLVHLGDRRLVLARTDKGYVAFADGCTHRGGSLADGVLIGGTVQCLWHGSQFDCATGAVACGPAKRPLRTYRVAEDRQGITILAKPEEPDSRPM